MSRPHPTSARVTALLVALVAFGPVSIDIFLPSLPDMTRVFATDVSRAQLTLSAFIAGFAVAQLVYGPLSDRFGRRPVLLAGMAIYTLGSAACLAASSIEALVAFRVVQALGACAGPVLARAAVRDVYPREQAARVLSLLSSAMAIAPALAPIVGGLLYPLGWRASFVAMVVFGGCVLIGVWRLLDETNPNPDGQALRPRRMVETFALLCGDRVFIGHTICLALIYGGLFAFISGSSFVIIGVLGVAPERFGLPFAAVMLAYMAGAYASARFTARVGLERMIRIGVGAGLASGLVLAGLALARVQTIAAVVLPSMAIFGALGLSLPNTIAAALAPHGRIAGSASALLGFVQMVTGASFGWAVGRLHDGTSFPMAALMAAGSLGGVLIHLTLLRPRAAGAGN